MITTTSNVSKQDFKNGTGWELKPEGACRGTVCIPLPPETMDGDLIQLEALAEAMHLPIVHDSERSLWALGPASSGGRALSDVQADFELPTLEGTPFQLASLRGKKVLVYAWAPY